MKHLVEMFVFGIFIGAGISLGQVLMSIAVQWWILKMVTYLAPTTGF